MERTIDSKRKPGVAGALVAVILIAGVAIAARYIEPGFAPYTPSVLRIGVLPDQKPQTLQQKFGPLVDYLAEQTGGEARLVIPADYYDAIRLFSEGKVDLAYFGGLTFVQAQAGFNAEALVMREIDTRFSSWFLVRSEHSRQDLSDFRGKRLGFGSKLSTSGHLMPRHFLRQRWQIDAESYFSDVSYSGAHDKTVLQVSEGKVDVGAANSLVVKKMIADGRLAPDRLRVLWQTPPYPDYVWAVRESLDDGFKTKLRDAFLNLDADDPGEAEVLAGLNAKIFLPADPGEFVVLHETAVSLELMDRESE